MTHIYKSLLISTSFLLFLSAPVLSKDIPKLTGWVTDYAGILTADQEKALTVRLEQHEKQTANHNEVAICTLKSLERIPIERRSIDIANAARIGKKDKDNGVLFLMAMEEREMRIEVGSGLEGDLPDIVCRYIIDNVAKPRFKEEEYYKGLNEVVDKIFASIKGEFTAESVAAMEMKQLKKTVSVILLVVLFVVAVCAGMAHRALGSIIFGLGTFFLVWWVYSLGWAIFAGIIGAGIGAFSPDIGDRIASSSGGGSYGGSWSSSGDGGGSFGGFGGGGFSGGGCSGGW